MLQTKTAEEILSTVFKPKEFIIDGLLTQGLYVLAGAQKVRKSWLAMDICLSIATGVPVLGRDTIQGTSLYLCLEDNYQRVQDRLFQMNAEPIENLHFATVADKIGGGLEEQIELFKKEHSDLKIVVVDVMQMVRSNVESSYGTDYAELISLKQLAYRLGICIMLIHHTRKCKDNDPFNMISGSTGISGSADGSFVLVETRRGSGHATLHCVGRDFENAELRMHFDTDVMRWIMRCALGKKIVVATGIDEIVRQQKAIGRNLNQIATLANMDRLTAVNFQPLLDEHRKVTEMIGKLLREVK
ncbi:AAA family ATPase [Ruminococcus flavefaciens]|uniref:AAA family ATPase n=1 Tax=Ruminococcus flavefaciens TaxID=1265 RepID=UPI0026F330B2|nr:AAA family ATPase [Ruminococcus flavefaciens]